MLTDIEFKGMKGILATLLFVTCVIFSACEANSQETDSNDGWLTYHDLNKLHDMSLIAIIHFFEYSPDSTVVLTKEHGYHKDYRDLFYWITSERVDGSERNWLIVTIDWAEGMGEERFTIKPEDLRESDFIHYVSLFHEDRLRRIEK